MLIWSAVPANLVSENLYSLKPDNHLHDAFFFFRNYALSNTIINANISHKLYSYLQGDMNNSISLISSLLSLCFSHLISINGD